MVFVSNSMKLPQFERKKLFIYKIVSINSLILFDSSNLFLDTVFIMRYCIRRHDVPYNSTKNPVLKSHFQDHLSDTSCLHFSLLNRLLYQPGCICPKQPNK